MESLKIRGADLMVLPMKKPKRVRVNYRLCPDVKESVEQIATDTGKTMTEIVETAVKLYAEKIATNPAE